MPRAPESKARAASCRGNGWAALESDSRSRAVAAPADPVVCSEKRMVSLVSVLCAENLSPAGCALETDQHWSFDAPRHHDWVHRIRQTQRADLCRWTDRRHRMVSRPVVEPFALTARGHRPANAGCHLTGHLVPTILDSQLRLHRRPLLVGPFGCADLIEAGYRFVRSEFRFPPELFLNQHPDGFVRSADRWERPRPRPVH